MVLCVSLGMCTGLIFLIVLLFASGGQDAIDKIIQSSADPLLEILCVSTRSRIWAACLLVFPILCLVRLYSSPAQMYVNNDTALWRNKYHDDE